jgi:hypothetical protein
MNTPARHTCSLAALFVFALLGFGSVDTDSDTKKVKSQPSSYSLDANQLFRDYKANEVAADDKYKGQVVTVSGVIQNIGKDITGNAYVVIGGEGFLDGVQCTFTRGEQSSVARLSKGQFVTVKGEVTGKMGNVLMNKCSLQ